jgi:hypothetical protein
MDIRADGTLTIFKGFKVGVIIREVMSSQQWKEAGGSCKETSMGKPI